MHQLRYAVRLLTRNPGFTGVAVACLGLGIGATTAIFSVVNAVLLRPLPYARSGQLVRVFTEFPVGANPLRNFWVSGPEFLELKRDTTSWNGFEFWINNGVNLAGTSEPIRATASFVSWSMLPMLGVRPTIGRTFSAEDDRPGVPATAVLSYGLWQRAFGGDPNILGRDIRMNGVACTVIGVMPPGFAFPPGELDAPELWIPARLDPANPGSRGGHNYSVLARLRDGVSLTAAQGELQRYVKHVQDTRGTSGHYFHSTNHTVVTAGFQNEVVKGVRRAMLVLLGAVAFVLLIACVNVANLLLARSEARRREIAVRAAIGAGLGKLLQQFVIEGLLLSLAGAALGTLLAFGGLRLLVATNAGSIPRSGEINIDWQVLLFTLCVSVLTGVTFGLAPAIHMRASALHETLKAAAGRATSTVLANRFRAALVTAELALALVLLIGSGLMVKAFWKLSEVNSGLDPTRMLTMRFSLPVSAYRDAAAIGNFHQALTARVQSLPGVSSAAVAFGLPPVRQINANTTAIEGATPPPGSRARVGGDFFDEIDYYNYVSARYFETVGARLVEGRLFHDGDGASSNPVVVVNQTMARRYWPNESAVGHRIRNGGPTSPWRTIVGVVSDVKNAGLDRPTGTELYFPMTQIPMRLAYLFVKTKGDPMSMANAIRVEFQGLDRALPISNLRTMDDVMDSARARPRFLTLLLTLFSSIALLLAALGIYGVISYSVAQRTNEIGVRMALGALPGDVLKLVGFTGLRFAVAGTVLGAAGGFALTRTMSGLLFGVSSFDVGTFLLMAATLVVVTLAACWIPARRASRVDPLVALRYE